MITLKQNEDLGYDLVDQENNIVWTEQNLPDALHQMIERNRNTQSYLAGKARELQIMEIALQWSDIQINIEAEKRSIDHISVADETKIRLEMAEIALSSKENKLLQKRPLKKLPEASKY